jgi:hypothetical protein
MSIQIAGNTNSLVSQLQDLVSDSLEVLGSPQNSPLKNDASSLSRDTISKLEDVTKLAQQMLGGLGNTVDTLA